MKKEKNISLAMVIWLGFILFALLILFVSGKLNGERITKLEERLIRVEQIFCNPANKDTRTPGFDINVNDVCGKDEIELMESAICNLLKEDELKIRCLRIVIIQNENAQEYNESREQCRHEHACIEK